MYCRGLKEGRRKINEQDCGPQTWNVKKQSSRRECPEISDISDGAEDNEMEQLKQFRDFYQNRKLVYLSFMED